MKAKTKDTAATRGGAAKRPAKATAATDPAKAAVDPVVAAWVTSFDAVAGQFLRSFKFALEELARLPNFITLTLAAAAALRYVALMDGWRPIAEAGGLTVPEPMAVDVARKMAGPVDAATVQRVTERLRAKMAAGPTRTW